MTFDDLKDITIQFLKPISVVVGLVGGVIAIAAAVADVSVWVLAALAIVLSILTALCLYLYVNKSVQYRKSRAREEDLLRIFDKTHTTWHVFKRLSDSIHVGVSLDSGVLSINKAIVNIIGNFRDALRDLHPENTFRVSMKAIAYKNSIR